MAGQAACLYSLMRPSQRVVRTSRRGNGSSVVLLPGVVCRGGRWFSERCGRPEFKHACCSARCSRSRAADVGFSRAIRSTSWRFSAVVGGRPAGRMGWVQWRAIRRRCQRSRVSGVTSQPARCDRGKAAATAPSRARSTSASAGRLFFLCWSATMPAVCDRRCAAAHLIGSSDRRQSDRRRNLAGT